MNIFLTILFSVFMLCLQAQSLSSSYEELQDPDTLSGKAWSMKGETAVSFVSANIRFEKGRMPSVESKQLSWQAAAWRGEKVHTQFLIWTTRPLRQVNFEIKSLKNDQ